MSSSTALREIFMVARPLVEQWLDVGEQIAALREVATAKGLDWSQLKALLKAQIQDERDEASEGKRVKRIVEKAEFASAYADMLGLANVNENNFSGTAEKIAEGLQEALAVASGQADPYRWHNLPPHDADGVVIEDQPETADQSSTGEGAAEPAVESQSIVDVRPKRGSNDANTGGDHVTEIRTTNPTESTSLEPAGALKSAAPAFSEQSVTNSKPVRNERCQGLKPSCAFLHHPHKGACATCQTAWDIAQSKERARQSA